MEDYLYKYTTLESLALILKSRKIRLNPLSGMDDIQESKTNDFVDFSRFVFVSSWMNQPKESIAMWKLYADMSNGVRIALKRNPFKRYHVTSDEVKQKMFFKEFKGENDFILPFEECFCDDYTIQNFIYDGVLNRVLYSDDTRDLYPQILNITKNDITLAYDKLGIYKNTYWEFQNEERYILRFFPFGIKEMSGLENKTAEYVYRALVNRKPFLPYKDLEIDDEAFSRMKITTSPNFTEGNKVILNVLKDSFNTSMCIEKSELSNSIAI